MTVSTEATNSTFVRRTVVGVGDIAFSSDPNTNLSTYALGSCIGVIAYDPVITLGGLLHFMLPNSGLTPEKAQMHPAMFADSGMEALLEHFKKSKSNPGDIKILIAGGASLLSENDIFKIGEKNIEAVRGIVGKHKLQILSEEIGGYNNRTLHFSLQKKTVEITSSTESKEISL